MSSPHEASTSPPPISYALKGNTVMFFNVPDADGPVTMDYRDALKVHDMGMLQPVAINITHHKHFATEVATWFYHKRILIGFKMLTLRPSSPTKTRRSSTTFVMQDGASSTGDLASLSRL